MEHCWECLPEMELVLEYAGKGGREMQEKRKYIGIFYIIVSAFFFALMAMFVRLSGDLPSVQKSFFRNLSSLILATVIIKKEGVKFSGKRENLKYLFFRSAAGQACGVWDRVRTGAEKARGVRRRFWTGCVPRRCARDSAKGSARGGAACVSGFPRAVTAWYESCFGGDGKLTNTILA